MAAWGYEFHLRVLKVSSMSISLLDSLMSGAHVRRTERTGIECRLVKKRGTCNWSYPAFIFSVMVEKKQFKARFFRIFYPLKFGFIKGVDNVNWPPYRDSKS